MDKDVRLHYASRDGERAERFRADFGGDRAYGSYRAALADPQIDVALVVTPPASHLELVIEALESGKHAIVEKPAFLRSADFDQVRAVSTRTGRRVFVAENYYYKPLRTHLEQLFRDRLVGEPLFLRVDATRHQEASGWRSDPDQAGGGALFEGGIHWVHLMANVGLTVQRVTGYRTGPGRGAAESVLVVFEYEGGPIGTLSYSWTVPSPLRGLRSSRIVGSRGTATFESNGVFVFVNGDSKRFRCPGFRDISGYRSMFRDFFHAIRTGAESGMTLDLAVRDIRLVEEAYRFMADEDLHD